MHGGAIPKGYFWIHPCHPVTAQVMMIKTQERGKQNGPHTTIVGKKDIHCLFYFSLLLGSAFDFPTTIPDDGVMTVPKLQIYSI